MGWLYFGNEPTFKVNDPKSEGPAVIYTLSFGVSNPSINLDITAVFNATLFGTFTEIKGNL